MDRLDIDGAWTFSPRVFSDERGDFLEWFRGPEFQADLGYRLDVAQVNCSVSRLGTIRGIHFSQVPPGQAKFVGCIRGAVLDVVVDLRTGSPTFGQWQGVRLDDTSRTAVFLAEGLGHGFAALTPEATVLYLCSTPYAPGAEWGVQPFDPDLAIDWPRDIPPILSPKDQAAPSLREAADRGLLPSYADCVSHAARHREPVAGAPA